jgi:glycosyltransferase involved in cell wall biosynthesis
MGIIMIEEKLEILLITYNRSKDLENTFEQLLESPFANCKFTVLDNCSEDETPKLCSKYQKLFPKMRILRHGKNIGAEANYLRAVETSKSIYTWILCDDDNYDFSNCSDVVDVINSGSSDLICVSSPSKMEWERGIKTTSKKLINDYNDYFRVFSFIPSLIFKTNLYDSECIIKSYSNFSNLFPQLIFIIKSEKDDFSVYIAKKAIVERGSHNLPSFSSLAWLNGFINTCSQIKNKKIRRKAMYGLLEDNFFKNVIYFFVLEKMWYQTPYKNIVLFFYSYIITIGFSLDVIYLVLLLPFAFMPIVIYKYIFKLYILLKYEIHHKTPPESIQIETIFD